MKYPPCRQKLSLKVKQIGNEYIFSLISLPSDKQPTLEALSTESGKSIRKAYQSWLKEYESFYKNTASAAGKRPSSINTTNNDDDDDDSNGGSRLLRDDQDHLVKSFNEWLNDSPKLSKIREAITTYVNQTINGVDLLIDCTSATTKDDLPLNLLPWESWQLLGEVNKSNRLRIARSIPSENSDSLTDRERQSWLFPRCQPRLNRRILAIIGDDRGITPKQVERRLKPLRRMAELIIIDGPKEAKTSQSPSETERKIAQAIRDPKGWDLLFFIGHGVCEFDQAKIGIAPDILMSRSDLEDAILDAIKHGLQCAILISCHSLHLGEELIRLGLHQAIVIREQIRSDVAIKFLTEFCRYLLSQPQIFDVHDSLRAACQVLERERLSFPSAHLISSFLQQSNAHIQPFYLEPSRLKRWLTAWQPTRPQAITLSTITLLSLITPLRSELLDGRYWVQAVYRNTTGTIWPSPTPSPAPVTIVAIDQATIDQTIPNNKVNPIDRGYIAKLINRLREVKATVIGINYLLDGTSSYPDDDQRLKKVIQDSVQPPNPLWLTFASWEDDTGQLLQLTDSLAKQQVLRSDAGFWDWKISLPTNSLCALERDCPFAYQLALAHRLRQSQRPITTMATVNLRSQMVKDLQELPATDPARTLFQLRSLPFGLEPTIDFSIPPSRVYRWRSAREVLQPKSELGQLGQQVVILTAGGYDRAPQRDNLAAPSAILYWRQQRSTGQQPKDEQPDTSTLFPSGAAQAYMVHHFLSQHLLLRLPDIWCVLVSALAAKGILLVVRQRSTQPRQELGRLAVVPLVYGASSLVLYQSTLVLLPWFFPSIVFWLYLLLDWRTFDRE